MSSVLCFREFVSERLTAVADEIYGVFEKTILVYEEEIKRQRRLLDIVLRPETKLHRKEFSLSSVCNEEAFREQQLKNSALDPEAPQIKEEQQELYTSQDVEQLVLRSVYEGSDHSEDQILLLDPDQTQNAAEKEPVNHISVMAIKAESDREVASVSVPNGDHHLSHNFQICETQDCEGGNQVDADQKPNMYNFKCLFCSEEFHDFLKLKIHTKTHSGEKLFKCDTCGKGFTQRFLVRKHMMTHTQILPFKCRVCGKEFRCQPNLDNHMKTHSDDKPYTCITCGKSFCRSADLKRHHRTHTGEKPYSCIHCGKDFPYHSSLTNHVRVHTGEKPYKCTWCGKRFAVHTTLKIHTRVHTGEKPYECNFCGRNFAQNTSLRIHKRIHVREKQQS